MLRLHLRLMVHPRNERGSLPPDPREMAAGLAGVYSLIIFGFGLHCFLEYLASDLHHPGAGIFGP